ncbi:cupin domain-containing protein [Paenibacillus medicaginis]|uniref:cupin domain-containing protein n=1 Tax=Paenibacillus medicaginis TaxID=1470560 RepID=UPI004055757D
MKHSIYELVVTDDSLPFDVSLHSVNYVPSHWHNSVEIIFVLRGSLEATVGPRKYALQEGDVLLINQCHVHEVIGLDHNIIATVLIPVAYLREHINQLDGIQLDCYSGSVGSDKKKALDHIRRLLAEMVQLRYKKGEAFKLEMEHRRCPRAGRAQPLVQRQDSYGPQLIWNAMSIRRTMSTISALA